MSYRKMTFEWCYLPLDDIILIIFQIKLHGDTKGVLVFKCYLHFASWLSHIWDNFELQPNFSEAVQFIR